MKRQHNLVAEQKRLLAQLEHALSVTSDSYLRQFYIEFHNGFTELSEIFTVGVELLNARQTQNTDLFVGLAKSFVTKEAKELALPIISSIELQHRIKRWVEVNDRRDKEIRRNMGLLLSDLKIKRKDWPDRSPFDILFEQLTQIRIGLG